MNFGRFFEEASHSARLAIGRNIVYVRRALAAIRGVALNPNAPAGTGAWVGLGLVRLEGAPNRVLTAVIITIPAALASALSNTGETP